MKPTTLIKIPDNLTDEEHIETAKKLSFFRIDGIELSEFGSRWGATWQPDKNYNLDFLKFYKGIKTLRLYLPCVENISPLLTLAESLENIELGEFKNKNISLDILENFKNLNYVSVVRHLKGLESIVKLPKLTELGLTGYSIDKLDFLNELKNLRKLYVGFGTSKSLDNINQLSNLEELNILWIKQLSNINAISNLTSLIKLKIEDEKQIISLPDLSKLNRLKNIRLMNLSSLEDLSNLTKSNLEEFILTGPNKDADILKPIRESKSLSKVYTYFYSKREQAKAEQILGSKFQSLDKMNFEFENIAELLYHNITTGDKIN